MMNLQGTLPKVHGRISASVRNAKRSEQYCFPNTLTQRAYELLYGTGVIGQDISTTRLSNVFRYLTLGSGSETIDYTSTALSNPRVPRAVGTQMSVLDRELNGEPCRVFQLSYQFEEGAYVGSLTEIGAVDAVSPYVLTAGSQVLDEMGQPTAIDVLADDVLTVNYEFYFPVSEFEQSQTFAQQTVNIAGTDYDVAFTHPALLNWATATTACIIKPWWQGQPEDVTDGYKAPEVNTVLVPNNQCSVTTSAGQDLLQGTTEFTTNITVFGSFTAPTLDSIAVLACPQYASAQGTRPMMVTAEFTPGVPRPGGDQIILAMTIALSWPTS